MHRGFAIVEEMIAGLAGYLDDKGMGSVADLRGKALGYCKEWGELDMNYRVVAAIDQASCIGCNTCYTACNDGAYQAITHSALHTPTGKIIPEIITGRCAGCNLCSLVCPVSCITMVDISPTDQVETWQERISRSDFTVSDGIITNNP
jgi:dihydropyrimidine dehydrogenase (NAD+) subunit PreA